MRLLENIEKKHKHTKSKARSKENEAASKEKWPTKRVKQLARKQGSQLGGKETTQKTRQKTQTKLDIEGPKAIGNL